MEGGASFGPYRIEHELGAGGMGTVYSAVLEQPAAGLAAGTRVALKVVHPHLLVDGDGEAAQRFRREVEIGRSIRHPNVVRTLDGGDVDGRRYMAMELVEGQTLRELLGDAGTVSEQLGRHVGREVAKGLAAIHAAGALHRDVKPDNVLITPDHVVKVMDLGVARLQDEALRLSRTGSFVGSLHYAAPECFRAGGKDVDARADLHALGLVLYELISGVSPNAADRVPEVIQRVLHDEPRRLGELDPQLSPFLEEVVHCLVAKSPDERFPSASELVATLVDGEDSAWWQEREAALRSESSRPLRRIRIPRDTAVYGRESELRSLTALFESATSGEGRVVLIEGEAGIGKSRLVDELVARLHAAGEDLNFLFGGYPPGGATSATGAFAAAFNAYFGDEGPARCLEEIPLLAPAFAALLRGDAPPEGAPPLGRNAVGTCLVHALRGLSAERPTILLVDDLHFASHEARALFSTLATAVPGHRVLLIGTTRPGVPAEWTAGLTRLDHTTHVLVPRLGPKDLVLLLRDALESEALARELGDQIAVKSDGNPFFVFEIVRGLREGKFITRTEHGDWVTDPRDRPARGALVGARPGQRPRRRPLRGRARPARPGVLLGLRVRSRAGR